LAVQYSRLVLLATEAEKKGVEKNPEAQQLLQFARMQALAQAMTLQIQKQSKPTPVELQKYYESNPQRFTELTLQRLMLPLKPDAEGKTNEAEMKTAADQLRQRAAGGADFKTLQAEAYDKTGLPNPPETKQVILATALPPSQQSVLQLKPGEVSQVIQEPGALYIYKLDSVRQIPLDQVKNEIESTLTQEKYLKAMEALLASSEPKLNPDYFGAAPPPAPSGMSIRPGAAPPQRPDKPTQTPPKP
jgi:peptidyl-prolyl cis-trans isomerase C